jgi:hypothetical protein
MGGFQHIEDGTMSRDEELNALDEAYKRELQDLFAIFFNRLAGNEISADAKKAFTKGVDLLKQAHAVAAEVIRTN